MVLAPSFVGPCVVWRTSVRCCSDAPEGGDTSNKKRLRARVAYDGANYCGWQFQVNSRSVQGELEKVMSRRLGRAVRAVGASRTDSGVHARGQAFHVDIPSDVVPLGDEQLDRFGFVMNQMLPQDIRVSNVGVAPYYTSPKLVTLENTAVPKRVHLWSAMYDTRGKVYSYRFCVAGVMDPTERLYCHHEWRASRLGFSEELLRDAAARFAGTHDFTAFANSSAASADPKVTVNTVRTIQSIRVVLEDARTQIYRLEFTLDGALYKMVRNVVGTILDIACLQLDVGSIERLRVNKDRRVAPKSAPCHGLCLEEVLYDGWPIQ